MAVIFDRENKITPNFFRTYKFEIFFFNCVKLKRLKILAKPTNDDKKMYICLHSLYAVPNTYTMKILAKPTNDDKNMYVYLHGLYAVPNTLLFINLE